MLSAIVLSVTFGVVLQQLSDQNMDPEEERFPSSVVISGNNITFHASFWYDRQPGVTSNSLIGIFYFVEVDRNDFSLQIEAQNITLIHNSIEYDIMFSLQFIDPDRIQYRLGEIFQWEESGTVDTIINFTHNSVQYTLADYTQAIDIVQ